MCESTKLKSVRSRAPCGGCRSRGDEAAADPAQVGRAAAKARRRPAGDVARSGSSSGRSRARTATRAFSLGERSAARCRGEPAQLARVRAVVVGHWYLSHPQPRLQRHIRLGRNLKQPADDYFCRETL
eukprot:scaffold582_cov385-Prasinococcus_capsulatus_cf.AAC.11